MLPRYSIYGLYNILNTILVFNLVSLYQDTLIQRNRYNIYAVRCVIKLLKFYL